MTDLILRDLDRSLDEFKGHLGFGKDAIKCNAVLKAIDDELLLQSKKAIAISRFRLRGLPFSTGPLEKELSHLEQADTHMAEATERIQRHRRVIERLEKAHCRTDLAEAVLETMLDTFALMQEHRVLILNRLARMRPAMELPTA
jgi:hypothetical protein